MPARNGVPRLLLALAVALSAASARAERVEDFTASVPGLAGKSWLDLLRLIFPQLEAAPERGALAHGEPDLRPLGSDPFGGDCPDPLRLTAIEYRPVTIGGKSRLIVGVETEGDACAAAVALFEGAGDGRLLDAVDSRSDMHYSFAGDFVRRLGDGGQLVRVTSFHINAGEGFDLEALILASEAGLSSIGAVYAHSEAGCRKSIVEEASAAIAPDIGPMARITGYVKRSVQRLAADCQTSQGRAAVTIARIDWRWNAATRAYRRTSP